MNVRRSYPASKLPDAIHLMTAMRSGCRYFVSRDRRLRTPESMAKIAPDEASMSDLLQALA